ncbi:hypothetical protein [Streptomyces bugieae]|uniref:PBS lyase n=1 Tax=Streptomyces bugieae TaxID=3098223 RepID=A0ABU7NP82_9ACTN|nr:hypothetical protein [Streptomyces sp. DSM 41528]
MDANLDTPVDVDWAKLIHAYGTAEDVPALLQNLRSDDALTRERALDALYGGVHHQGDVYDSTLACIPHLLALAQDPNVPDRGPVIGLLTSIAATANAAAEEYGTTMPDPQAVLAEAAAAGLDPDEWWEEYACAHQLLAERALTAAVPSMLPLLADAEADVRAAAATFLVRCTDEPRALLPALTAGLRTEPHPATRQSLVEDLADLFGRLPDGQAGHPARAGAPTEDFQAAIDLLLSLSTGQQVPLLEQDPATVLAALTALAAHAPHTLPPDAADCALTALDRAGNQPAPPPPGGPDSDTMLSYLRTLRASAYPTDTEMRLVDALRDLHGALGARLHDRHQLVLHELRRAVPAVRTDTFDRIRDLYGAWRVPPQHAAQVAELLGTVLTAYAESLETQTEGQPDSQPEDVSPADTSPSTAASVAGACVTAAVAAAAAEELRCCCLPLTPDILDAAHRIADASGYRTDHGWQSSAGGACLQLLIAAEDRRGAHHLAELLYGRVVPEELPDWCRALGPHAATLVPALGARLQQAADHMSDHPDDDHALDEAARLLAALSSTGFDETAGVIAPFLDALADRAEEQETGLHRAGLLLLQHPDGIGPDAADHTPLLHRLLTDRSPEARIGAARALWHAEHNAASVLPVLTTALEATIENAHDRIVTHEALDLVAAMGPAAAPLAPTLRARLRAPHGHVLTTARTALALRAVSGPGNGPDTVAADTALLTAWTTDRSARATIAAGLHRQVPTESLPAGLPALLRKELADPRRLDNTGQPTRTRFRYQTRADEEFRAHATTLLARA